MSRKSHFCSLDLGSSSMLPKDYKPAICRRLRKLCLVSEHHPQTYRHLRSYATVVAERQRQISEGTAWMIHPFSLFRFFIAITHRPDYILFTLARLSWNSFMVLVNLLHMVLSTMRLTYVLDPFPLYLGPNNFDHTLLCLHFLCMIDILMTFNVGYVEEHGSIILYRKAIASRYLRSWFLVDLISCLPVAYLLLILRIPKPRCLLLAHILPILRIACLASVMKNLRLFLQIFGGSYLHHTCINVLVLFILSTHWCGCMFYVCPILGHYWYGVMPQGYTLFLQWDNLNATDPERTMIDRYQMGTFIALASFFGSGFALFTRRKPDEAIVHGLILVYSALFMIYILAHLIKIRLSQCNSLIRYYELMNQVKEYMRHRQFPLELKKRVIAFYNYTFKDTYFREELIFKTLSDQLRNEVILHTCHKLVNKMELFDGLPASVVGSVLGCLHHEVYMPNDLVVRAGDLGHCMYFIANGTVAVYSLKGVEVCHLQDGAHFGEVALLMKDSKRTATVVAVEITQVYRLDAEDFRQFVVANQILYERIQALASQRMHETVLLDETFQRERVAEMSEQ